MVDDKFTTNIIGELRRGTQILQVLSQMDTTRYGYALLQTLEERGVQIEAGTLYPLLRRLESQGVLESEWDTSESRPRKYYKLSEDGHALFLRLKDEWRTISRELDDLLNKENGQ
jgi:PadR family transcriptional regulator, regulatory protein PadR